MRSRSRRLVVDTNALVSRLLLPESVPAQAVRRAVDEGILLVTEATLRELAEVLARPKFDRYVSLEERQKFLRLLGGVAEKVLVTVPICACRDPRDDKFLEAAFYGRAEAILTGEQDLLAMDPFRGIRILTPACWLECNG